MVKVTSGEGAGDVVSKVVAKQIMAETGKTRCKWWARVDGKCIDMSPGGWQAPAPFFRGDESLQAHTGQQSHIQAKSGHPGGPSARG